MGKGNSKKRKNRPVSRANSSKILPLPPLPQLDVPTFQLSTNDNGRDTDLDDSQPHPKKKPKKEKPIARDVPEFCVSPTKLKRVVRVADLQQLVLWLLADGIAAQWLLVKRKQDIRKVVVVMVPGLDMDLLDDTAGLGVNAGTVTRAGDIGEVIERKDGMDEPAPEIPDGPTGACWGPSELGEGGESEDQPVQEGTWTIVGSKRDVHGKPFSFYPSLLSRKPLAPCLAPLKDMFTHVWPTKTDGDDKTHQIRSPISHFLNCPLDKQTPLLRPKYPNTSRICITQLLMTPEQLYDDGYPMHSCTIRRLSQQQGGTEGRLEEVGRLVAEGWVETEVTGLEQYIHNEAGSVTEGRKIFSVDCEMCNTEVGPELTRISVVGWDGTVVYNTLVKPPRPIVDYLTHFSGITKESLESVTMTLSDVQSHLLLLFQPAHKVILVGQSLNSDLKALKLMHPYIVDTSVIFGHSSGKPYKPSLKWLAMKYLKREIQRGRHVNLSTNKMELGHDSIEDALACIDLVKLKLEKGLAFGSIEASTESIFSRLERGHASQGNRHKLCWGAVVDYGNPSMLYTHAKRNIACQNDDDVVNGVREVLGWRPELQQPVGTDPRAILAEDGEISFVWARLRELEVLRQWDTSNRQQKAPDDPSSFPPIPLVAPDPPAQALAGKVAETVARLHSIYNGLPPNTAFIVYSGTGDPREMSRLRALLQRFKEEYKFKKWDDLSVKWTDDEQQALNRAIKVTKEGGLSFMTVKVDRN